MKPKKIPINDDSEIKALKKQISRLNNNLKRRIRNIEQSTETYKFSADKYNKLDKSLRGKDKQQLKDLFRDLLYIDNLKTSRFTGAVEANKTYGKIEKNLTSLSPKLKDEFWDAYGRIYENYGGAITEKYKYIFWEAVSQRQYSGESVDDIVKGIIEKFDRKWENYGGDDFAISETELI